MGQREPPTTPWVFPPLEDADEQGLVGVGGDLEPGTLLAAYRNGLFPMPLGRSLLGWWSPNPRAIVPLDRVRPSRSLRRSLRHYELRIDTACDEVIAGCADPARPHGWITPEMHMAYMRLHRMGWVHSVEAWSPEDGTLAGGLYGVAVGGLFAGESMFYRRTDASKVAFVGLVELMGERDADERLLDVQWLTPHLASLGATEVPRSRYIEMLQRAVDLDPPPAFAC